MANPKQWDFNRLERALRRALRKRTRVRLKPLRGASAYVEWTDGGPIDADVDPLTVSHLAGTIHELMHPVLEKELEHFSPLHDEMAEVALNAWETALADRIIANARKKLWWRRAINGRLKRR